MNSYTELTTSIERHQMILSFLCGALAFGLLFFGLGLWVDRSFTTTTSIVHIATPTPDLPAEQGRVIPKDTPQLL